ncbi:SGNH hydrolase-type esterase domain-containing protein [Boeremia exigua]|uniref:SGNH hydrolase-type esterase domain-containing protein n=1 Tax=Boeremia exigua TaxID=749465 RepID=UPI001E8EBF94|nr:SGNH hydrolase-type esterase domain-containing protein [Boeremia exigua]KAH6614298.1 SGNH hydrolase-type esterase domain-containing protein [Boeremia exigua]
MALQTQKPQFILFGDSLTEWGFEEFDEGFGWFLEQKYKDKVHVQCEGRAGFTSTNLLPDFDRIIAQATSPNAPKTLLFTIFLGANDACLNGMEEYVPLPQFEQNICKFVETILTQDALPETKIVLITPPPINILSPLFDGEEGADLKALNEEEKLLRGYRTYMNKKRYAEKIMQIAVTYEETGRVAGLDFWGDLVRAKLQEIGEEYDEERLPGSGLYGVGDFGKGYFTDGLHLDKKAYNVLSRTLYDTMVTKWPQLAPELL